ERVTDFSDTLSFDLFSEFSYALTDDLEFTVGARFTRDQRETRFFSTVDQPNPLTPIITQGLPGLIAGETGGVISSADQPGLEDTFGGFSWRAVLNYQLGANKFAYFNYSRGRRAEVIQDEFTRQGSAVVGAFEIVPAETVDSYEIGFKGAFYSNRIVLDLASYFYDYNNFQTAINVAGPGEPPDLDILNGGTAEAYGVELGLTATPRDDVSFFVTYGYNRGRFDERGPDGQAQAFGGNRFAIAPDHTLSLGANLELQTPLGRAFVIPTYTWKSDVFFTDENQEAYRIIEPQSGDVLAEVAAQGQEAFGLINIRGGIDLSDQVTAELFVQNLADKDYLIEGGGVSAAFGIPSFIAGPPRFYGGSVIFRY
ncbi:MAG: TonB-dependent receptor, partial [Pseudomonadota bacterium]